MQINNIPASQISPGREEKKQIFFKDVENYILSKFTTLDTSYYGIYERNKIKNNFNFLNDFLENYRSTLSEKNSSETENISIINKIFKTIEIQLNLLNDLQIKKNNNADNTLIAAALVLSFLKKNFID